MTTRFNFTKAAIAALPLPPPGGRVSYLDTRVAGLQLRTTAGGAKTFSFVYRLHGIQQRLTLGSAGVVTVDQARRTVLEMHARVLAGENPAGAKRNSLAAASSELTLGEAFERYFEDHLIVQGKRTASALRADFGRYLGTIAPGQKKCRGKERQKSKGSVNWDRRKLSTITSADIRRMMITLKAGTGARTANKTLVLLSAVYRKCGAWKLYAGTNPCDDPSVKKFASGEQSRDRFLDGEDLVRFITALETMDSDFQDFVKLCLFTGARRANLLSMRWEDIRWDRATWIVPGEQSKNGEPLAVPLLPTALELLCKRHDLVVGPSRFVFPASSKSGHMSPPAKKWKVLINRAEIRDLRLHDLRRTMGSWMVNTGASLAVVGASLGHRSQEATRVYARLQLDPVRESMQRGLTAMMNRAHSGSGAANFSRRRRG